MATKSKPSKNRHSSTVKQGTVRETKPKPVDKPGEVSLAWQWPTTGKVINGFVAHKAGKKGIDIAGTSGQSVRAATTGKVVYSGSGLIGYGQLVIIKHNDIFLSAYAHNRKLLVKEGQLVKGGQRIAELGQTGTDRPKLYFEIRRYGRPVDPLRYLPRR